MENVIKQKLIERRFKEKTLLNNRGLLGACTEETKEQLTLTSVVGQSEQYYCYKENHGSDRCKENTPCKDCSCYN